MSSVLDRPALLTDLYQLTMLGGQFALGRLKRRAVFEYFFRKLPPDTGFAVFAGLEDLLGALQNLRFHAEELEYLRSLKLFSKEFLEYLAVFRFTGDLYAMPEGELVYPHEPLVRVDAPLPEAQLIETLLLNVLNYQTLVATKAARIGLAAGNDPVIEFGLRRAQGPEGGLAGSRAAFIGGCSATSNVAAGMRHGIPVRGTHAHSWVMSFDSELEAFRAYAQIYPEHPLFLVDTFDTLKSGVPNAIIVFNELRARGFKGRVGIRLDSGDLARLSIEAHRLLDAAGYGDALIVASNDLDEDLVADLKRQDAKINCWGIGTKLVTGGSTPALGGVYKLAAIANEAGVLQPRIKVSGNPEKTTDPGVKTPARVFRADGTPEGDVLFAVEEPLLETLADDFVSPDRQLAGRGKTFSRGATVRPLLKKVISGGQRVGAPEPLTVAAQRAKENIARLIPEARRLRFPDIYWVGLSPTLYALKLAELARAKL